MLHAGECVVVFEPSVKHSRSWVALSQEISIRIEICETLPIALRSLASERAAAVVASGPSIDEALTLVRAARDLHPPAEVVLVSDETDGLRVALREAGLYAELLSAPASVTELVRRLGVPRSMTKTMSKKHW